MDFLGIGPLELVFILLIALIIFGPKDIAKASQTVGRFLRRVVTSDGWKAFQQASKGMRTLPNTLMREAGLEEEELKRMTGMTDLNEAAKDIDNKISLRTTLPSKTGAQPETPEGASSSESKSPPKVKTEDTTTKIPQTTDDN